MKQILLVPETGPGWGYNADVLLLVTVEEDFWPYFCETYFLAVESVDNGTRPSFLGILTTLSPYLRVDIMQKNEVFNGDMVTGQVIYDLASCGVSQIGFQMGGCYNREAIEFYRGDPDLADWTVFELLFMPNGVIRITGGEIWVDIDKELLQ